MILILLEPFLKCGYREVLVWKSLDYLVDNFGLVGSTKKVYQARLSTEFRFESNSVDNMLSDRVIIHSRRRPDENGFG